MAGWLAGPAPLSSFPCLSFACLIASHPTQHNSHPTTSRRIYRQLLRDKQVKFAGYIHPHPLLHKIEVRVQTVDRNVSTPMQALENALSDLNQEFMGLKSRFQVRGGDVGMWRGGWDVVIHVDTVHAHVQVEARWVREEQEGDMYLMTGRVCLSGDWRGGGGCAAGGRSLDGIRRRLHAFVRSTPDGGGRGIDTQATAVRGTRPRSRTREIRDRDRCRRCRSRRHCRRLFRDR